MMKKGTSRLHKLAAALTSLLAVPAPLAAHVTLDTAQAPALAYVRIAIRVPHGCEGAGTVALRLQIPDGVTSVKPMVKAGWSISLDRADGTPASAHDATPVVREVAWRGGPLPDEFYDEFVLRIRMPDTPNETIWFPCVQECEGGKVSRWIERPAEGLSIEQLRFPAYPVRILPRP